MQSSNSFPGCQVAAGNRAALPEPWFDRDGTLRSDIPASDIIPIPGSSEFVLRDDPLFRHPRALRVGDMYDVNASVRGGTGTMGYFMSFNKNDERGVYFNNFFNRIGGCRGRAVTCVPGMVVGGAGVLEAPDAQVAARDARQHGARQHGLALHGSTGGDDREAAGGRDAERVHRLADEVLAQRTEDAASAQAVALDSEAKHLQSELDAKATTAAEAGRMLMAAGTPEFTERSITLYGRPDDLRRFVDRAHAAGLGVILEDEADDALALEALVARLAERRIAARVQNGRQAGGLNRRRRLSLERRSWRFTSCCKVCPAITGQPRSCATGTRCPTKRLRRSRGSRSAR